MWNRNPYHIINRYRVQTKYKDTCIYIFHIKFNSVTEIRKWTHFDNDYDKEDEEADDDDDDDDAGDGTIKTFGFTHYYIQ